MDGRMIETLEEIREGLRTGRYLSEAAVSRGIVMRLLQELGWNPFDTEQVWPEYTVEGTRVDYALCEPPRKPIAFIEVKQVGQGGDAERQLFQYAFHRGVPLAVLTTGQEWHFFLPLERGDYGERRVYLLDLLERETQESAARLRRYLEHGRVVSGAAIDAASDDYRDMARRRDIDQVMPEAWRKLLHDSDQELIDLLSDRVESLSGFRPEPAHIDGFLRRQLDGESTTSLGKVPPARTGQSRQTRIPPARVVSPAATKASPKDVVQTEGSARRVFGYEYEGTFHPCRNGRDVLVGVFELLGRRDPTFLERFATRKEMSRSSRRQKRPHLARDRFALHPGNSGLANDPTQAKRLDVADEWWIDLNVGHAQMKQTIEVACDVAELRYGADLRVKLG